MNPLFTAPSGRFLVDIENISAIVRTDGDYGDMRSATIRMENNRDGSVNVSYNTANEAEKAIYEADWTALASRFSDQFDDYE